MKTRPTQRDRQERDRVQHDGGADRPLVRHAVEHRGRRRGTRSGIRRPRPASGTATPDREQRHDQERARERHRNMECPRDEPDGRRDRQPQAAPTARRPAQHERGPPHHREAFGEGRHGVDEGCCRYAPGSARVSRSVSAPSRSGWPASTREHDQHRRRPRRPPAIPAGLHGGEQLGVGLERAPRRRRPRTRRTAARTIARSRNRSTMMVANAAVARQALAARQQVGPEHFAGARRQQGVGGEADDRGAERGRRSAPGRWVRAGPASGRPAGCR